MGMHILTGLLRCCTNGLDRMDEDRVRQLIRGKLAAGRLPRGRALDVWVVPADGQLCDACGQPIERQTQVVWAIQTKGGLPVQLHEDCFQLWEAETNGLA
jgi:hypothetical protein